LERFHPIIASIARRVSQRHPEIPFGDAESAGLMGLLDAISRFDDSKGVGLSTFSHYRILGSMLDEARSISICGMTGAGGREMHRWPADNLLSPINGEVQRGVDASEDAPVLAQRSDSPVDRWLLKAYYVDGMTVSEICALRPEFQCQTLGLRIGRAILRLRGILND
jgi:hypothetical protein